MTGVEARFFRQLDRSRHMGSLDPIACLETNGATWFLVIADGVNALQGYCLQVESNGSQTTA